MTKWTQQMPLVMEIGNTPTSDSTAYTEALTLEATKTIKAIAVTGGITSEVASKTFTKS